METNHNSPTGGTFNWGGFIFNVSGNVYFINPRVGYHGGYLRMDPNWFVLGWVTSTTKCHYYGDFLEDNWLDSGAKPGNRKTTYTAACG